MTEQTTDRMTEALRRYRRNLILALSFEQDDSAVVTRAKAAIRACSDADLIAVDAAATTPGFAHLIRDAAIAGGLPTDDVAPLVLQMVRGGVV